MATQACLAKENHKFFTGLLGKGKVQHSFQVNLPGQEDSINRSTSVEKEGKYLTEWTI